MEYLNSCLFKFKWSLKVNVNPCLIFHWFEIHLMKKLTFILNWTWIFVIFISFRNDVQWINLIPQKYVGVYRKQINCSTWFRFRTITLKLRIRMGEKNANTTVYYSVHRSIQIRCKNKATVYLFCLKLTLSLCEPKY